MKSHPSSSNVGGKECKRSRMHATGTASRYIWTQANELKVRKNRNRAERLAPAQDVTNIRGFQRFLMVILHPWKARKKPLPTTRQTNNNIL
jgi:hypothetical protein